MPIANIADLKAIRKIVVHGNCPDGLASAMILKDVLPDAEVIAVQHNSPEHVNLVPEDNMLFCDICPHPGEAHRFAARKNVWVLDHHRTAEIVVRMFGDRGIFADEKKEPGVCGAVLAYREVWLALYPEQPEICRIIDGVAHEARVKEFAELAGIRDTWQRQDPRWEAAVKQALVLRFFPQDQWLRQPIFAPADGWENRFALGDILLEREKEAVQSAIDKTWMFTTKGGTRVAMFQGTGLTSDVSEALGSDFDLIIGFSMKVEKHSYMRGWYAPPSSWFGRFLDALGLLGRRRKNVGPLLIASTRSRGNFNVRKLCEKHGGGGHDRAAGFSFNLRPGDKNPYTLLRDLLEAYEAGR